MKILGFGAMQLYMSLQTSWASLKGLCLPEETLAEKGQLACMNLATQLGGGDLK